MMMNEFTTHYDYFIAKNHMKTINNNDTCFNSSQTHTKNLHLIYPNNKTIPVSVKLDIPSVGK